MARARDEVFGGKGYAELGVARSRAALSTLKPPGGPSVPEVREFAVGRPTDVAVRVREYRNGPRLLIWAHGGGWTVGDLDTTDRTARELASRAGCTVWSVDYRLAPEHRYPAALDDVTTAIRAALADSDRPLVVGGESAGASLAIGACLRLRDEGAALSRVARQLLVVPVADLDWAWPSMRADADPLLRVADLRWFADNYLPDAALRNDGYVVPLCANRLAGLPPTTVLTAGFDPLGDGGRELARRLATAGVPVAHHDYPGAGHGFFAAERLSEGRAALEQVVTDLVAAHMQ